VIVPTAAVATIVELLERQSRVEVAAGGGGVVFRAGGEEFFTKLIEGNYPNYRQVIPSFRKPVSLRVARDAMRHALEWVKVVQKDKESSVKLCAEGSEITLSVSTPDVGAVEEKVALLAPIKGNVHVALQIRYLLPMVAREGGDEFILTTEFVADGVAMGALVVSEANEDFLGILMPMRIGS
jgi:DNA polymerase-3 subunit beta